MEGDRVGHGHVAVDDFVGAVGRQHADPPLGDLGGVDVAFGIEHEIVGGHDVASLGTDRLHRARGHIENPLTEQDLFAKFEHCLTVGRSVVPAQEMFERLKAMEHASARSLATVH